MKASFFRFPSSKPVDAPDWVALLRSPDATDADRKAFEAWLAAEPRNREAFARSASLQQMAICARVQHDMVAELLLGAERDSPAAGQSTLRGASPWMRFALAATFAVAVAGLGLHFAGVSSDAKVATRAGEQRVIHLEDGSTVQLNTNTQIAYQVDSSVRRVALMAGEAFFDVAKDPSGRPFVVQAGKSEIRVLGTQFSVRQAGERVEVIVKEGRVEVIPEARVLTGESTKRIELTPGNRMQVERQTIEVAAVDLNHSMAWRSGEIEFRGESLEQVIAELNRYTETPMVIEDESLRDLRVSGLFRVTDREGIRFMLRESLGLQLILRSNEVGLISKKH